MDAMNAEATHRTSRRLQAEWHKVAALLMAKLNLGHVVITLEDIRGMPEGQCLLAEELADGLHVRLVDLSVVPLLVARAKGPLQ